MEQRNSLHDAVAPFHTYLSSKQNLAMQWQEISPPPIPTMMIQRCGEWKWIHTYDWLYIIHTPAQSQARWRRHKRRRTKYPPTDFSPHAVLLFIWSRRAAVTITSGWLRMSVVRVLVRQPTMTQTDANGIKQRQKAERVCFVTCHPSSVLLLSVDINDFMILESFSHTDGAHMTSGDCFSSALMTTTTKMNEAVSVASGFWLLQQTANRSSTTTTGRVLCSMQSSILCRRLGIQGLHVRVVMPHCRVKTRMAKTMFDEVFAATTWYFVLFSVVSFIVVAATAIGENLCVQGMPANVNCRCRWQRCMNMFRGINCHGWKFGMRHG